MSRRHQSRPLNVKSDWRHQSSPLNLKWLKYDDVKLNIVRRHQSRPLNLLLTTDESMTFLNPVVEWRQIQSISATWQLISKHYVMSWSRRTSQQWNWHVHNNGCFTMCMAPHRHLHVISTHVSTCSWHICVTRNVHQHILCNTLTTSVSKLLQRSGSTQHMLYKDGKAAPWPPCPPDITPNTHKKQIKSTTAQNHVPRCQQHIYRLKNVSI